VLWSAIGNAAAALTLANANYATTFNQTSAVAWTWANTTVATVSTTNASPLLELQAQYWGGGGTTASDTWTIGTSLAAGLNGISTLAIAHVGGDNNNVVSINGNPPIYTTHLGLLTINGGTSTDYLLDLKGGSSQEFAIQLTSGVNYVGSVSAHPFVFFTNNGNGNLLMPVSGAVVVGNYNATDAGNDGTGLNNLGVTGHIKFALSATGAYDTGISRVSAGVLGIGTGTNGSIAGNLSYNRVNTAGADHAGQVTVTAGNTTQAKAFAVNYAGTGQPVVVLTPTSDPLALGVPVGYWVTYSGSTGAWTGFTVNVQTALAGNIVFNYVVIGVA
jgi:hypothetical protein